jgi:hypothetical protein
MVDEGLEHPKRCPIDTRLPEFRLGIIGGCLSHQRGVPATLLYHQQLAGLLKANDGLKLSLRFDHGYESSNRDRLVRLANRVPLDGVLLNVRAIFTRKAGILASYKSDGVRSYVVHPCLFRQSEFGVWNRLENHRFDGAPVITRLKIHPRQNSNAPLPGARIGKFHWRESNQFFGMLLGLDRWAIQDELFDLDGFHQICQEKRLPCFVLCPTVSASSLVMSHLCRKLNAALQVRLSGLHIPFCLPAGAAGGHRPAGGGLPPLHFGDGLHLTVDGHQTLAQQLYPSIAPWIQGILDKTVA